MLINAPIRFSFVIAFLLAVLLLPVAKSQTIQPASDLLIRVSGKVETSSSYCGGAAPPRHIVERLRRKKPYAGLMLYIRTGNKNTVHSPIIDSTAVNEDGTFIFHLPPGEYLLLSPDHQTGAVIQKCLENEYIKVTDWDCIEAWWQNGLMQLTIEDQPVDDLYFHFQKQCFLPIGVPCLQYVGSWPR